MAPTERDLAYLWDMHQAARDAAEFMTGMTRATWTDAKITRLAVERCIEIVGGAARHVSQETRERHPEIPWRQIVGLRNVLAHEYGQIDQARLFYTVESELPQLIQALRAMLPPMTDH